MRYQRAGALLWLFFLFASCANAENRPQPRLAARELAVNTRNGAVAVSAELAVTDSERTKGMMWRKTMNDGEGMLFVYDRDVPMSFWMKNTLIPLSIAFISASGVILEVRDMDALSTRAVKSERYCRYALETPQGWFARAGIQPGDTISGL
ncbi:MAG: DUF192 domain-containing protein [Spirochaetaceae bacterium]|jgi:uncharacterized membrane protein (UPF0127 family)|nr:DUF192 domain-containing protein [Spirochaetaceae bacterium]